MKKCDLFIFAGEVSGDVHGGLLLDALKSLDPSLNISGVGGPLMRTHLSKCYVQMEEFQVMGFFDIIKAFPKLFWNFHKLRRIIKRENPKAALFVDYPGFNIRLENAVRKLGYDGKLIHYISPTVWAWGKWREKYMIKNLDLLFSIYPFEIDYFQGKNLPVRFIGHPLVARVKNHTYKKLPSLDTPCIGIFPGSRSKEIERNLRLQLLAAKEFPTYQIAISIASDALKERIQEIARECDCTPLYIEKEFAYELMESVDFAIATSGSVNLELAMHHTPTVVTYGMTSFDTFLARKVFKIILPYYCIVNILLNKEVYPELYGPNLTLDRLIHSIKSLLENLRDCKEACIALEEKLTDKNSAKEAAAEILQVIKGKSKIPSDSYDRPIKNLH